MVDAPQAATCLPVPLVEWEEITALAADHRSGARADWAAQMPPEVPAMLALATVLAVVVDRPGPAARPQSAALGPKVA
jgi:hypothetical protein